MSYRPLATVVNPRACKIDIINVASTAWTATARCVAYRAPATATRARGAMLKGATAIASHRVRTTTYPAGSAPRAPKIPGTRRTPARWSSAKPAQSTTGGAARADHASTRPAALAPDAPHERFPRSPRVGKLPRAQTKGCPSQRHRRGAATQTTTKDGPPAAPITDGPRRRRFSIQQ